MCGYRKFRAGRLSALLLCLLPCFAVRSFAQTEADSAANALLSRSDEPSFQVDDVFDALEAGLQGLEPKLRSRAVLDPNANDERGAGSHSYLGTPVAMRSEIRLNAEPVRAGMSIQKDAWERSYADDWAGYVETLGPIPLWRASLDRVVLGNYRLSFGSGLMFGTGLSAISLRTDPSHDPADAFGVRHSMSPHAASPLLGAATELRLGSLKLIPFISRTMSDARIDSVGVRTIYSYFHRTPTEVSYRGALSTNTYGAHLSYHDSDQFVVGATYANQEYDAPLATTSSKLPKGKHLGLLGSDVQWRFAKKAKVSAEIATSRADSTSGLGYVVSLEATPWEILRTYLAYHHQDTSYFASHASIVGESEGDLSNHEGVWIGIGSSLYDWCSILTGIDYSRTLDKRALEAGEKKLDAFAEARCTPTSVIDVATRYRYRTSVTALSKYVDNKRQHNARMIAHWFATSSMSVALRAEATFTDHWNGLPATTGGVMQIDARLRGKGYSLASTIARFGSDDYDSRLYSYTTQVSEYGSILMFYGHGYYAGVSARVSPAAWCSMEAFAGGMFYDHGRTFGSGLSERRGANDLNVILQLSLSP